MFKNLLIILIGGKNFLLYKFLIILKLTLINFIKVYSHIKKKSYFFFFFKIFKSQFFLVFNPVKISEKKIINDLYKFKYLDFFSNNINVWKNFLYKLDKFNYLEIGTFEGRSALFVSELKNSKKIVCVDPYIEYEEAKKYNFKMSDVYHSANDKFIKMNTKKNIILIKKKSDDFFKNNQDLFQVIYIDGNHQYEFVKRDFKNAFNCLDNNGLLICDDFLWFKNQILEHNPIVAILECYYEYQKNLDILFISDQIIFKKTS